VTKGYLLLAHGARDPAWAQPFEAVAARLRTASPGTPVALSYLEFLQPDLVAAGERLVDQGCAVIEVVPLFLGAGGHVRKDVPQLLDRLRARRPGVALSLRAAIGEHPRVVEAMAEAVLAAAEDNPRQ
jgi:sirohydrochlorin cobaltochelatase